MILPVTAAAAADRGQSRMVRARGPLDDLQVTIGCRYGIFTCRNLIVIHGQTSEQPRLTQFKPASFNIFVDTFGTDRRSTCPASGTSHTITSSAFFPFRQMRNRGKSSIRPFVQLPRIHSRSSYPPVSFTGCMKFMWSRDFYKRYGLLHLHSCIVGMLRIPIPIPGWYHGNHRVDIFSMENDFFVVSGIRIAI